MALDIKGVYLGMLRPGDNVGQAVIRFMKNLRHETRGILPIIKNDESQILTFKDSVTGQIAKLVMIKTDESPQYSYRYYPPGSSSFTEIAKITTIGETLFAMDTFRFNNPNPLIYVGNTLNAAIDDKPEANWLTAWIGKDFIYGVISDYDSALYYYNKTVFNLITLALVDRLFEDEQNHLPLWVQILVNITILFITFGISGIVDLVSTEVEFLALEGEWVGLAESEEPFLMEGFDEGVQVEMNAENFTFDLTSFDDFAWYNMTVDENWMLLFYDTMPNWLEIFGL